VRREVVHRVVFTFSRESVSYFTNTQRHKRGIRRTILCVYLSHSLFVLSLLIKEVRWSSDDDKDDDAC
jgi:phage-related protein